MNNENKLSFKYAQLALRFKWLILTFTLLTTLFFALQIKNIDIRNDPDTLLPQTNKYVSTITSSKVFLEWETCLLLVLR